uniref:DUF2140 family protein n=1 Tax=Rhabditophanes sp. KR3021 TaxID=114890 RepID=A0AC35U5B0_9BILA
MDKLVHIYAAIIPTACVVVTVWYFIKKLLDLKYKVVLTSDVPLFKEDVVISYKFSREEIIKVDKMAAMLSKNSFHKELDDPTFVSVYYDDTELYGQKVSQTAFGVVVSTDSQAIIDGVDLKVLSDNGFERFSLPKMQNAVVLPLIVTPYPVVNFYLRQYFSIPRVIKFLEENNLETEAIVRITNEGGQYLIVPIENIEDYRVLQWDQPEILNDDFVTGDTDISDSGTSEESEEEPSDVEEERNQNK